MPTSHLIAVQPVSARSGEAGAQDAPNSVQWEGTGVDEPGVAATSGHPPPGLAKLGHGAYACIMTTVNVGQAKTELSRLIALALAGEEVEIARDGVPVVRLVALEQTKPGERFLAARGSLSGVIRIGDDFEFTDAELDEMLDP